MSGEISVLEGFVLLSHVRRHAQPVEQSPEAQETLEACLAAEEKRQADRQVQALAQGQQTRQGHPEA